MSRFTSSYEAEDFFKLSLEQKMALRNETTIEELIEEYLEKWAKPNKRSWKNDEKHLTKDVRPHWGELKATNITQRDVVLLLDKIVGRGAPIGANRALACIRRMFNFGMERGIVHMNPCMAIRMPSKETHRERVLEEHEIKILWHALEYASLSHVICMSEPTKLVIKLQLTLAQRKGEIVSAKWSDIDLDSRWWVIPATKTKNSKPHRVPLSTLAMDLLGKIKELSKGSVFLFPSKLTKTHINGAAIDHAVRRSFFHGIGHFTPHDFRRSAASYMTFMGIPRLTVSKILNHSEGDSITAVYDRYNYDKEKREALELWSEKLIDIVYGGK